MLIINYCGPTMLMTLSVFLFTIIMNNHMHTVLWIAKAQTFKMCLCKCPDWVIFDNPHTILTFLGSLRELWNAGCIPSKLLSMMLCVCLFRRKKSLSLLLLLLLLSLSSVCLAVAAP